MDDDLRFAARAPASSGAGVRPARSASGEASLDAIFRPRSVAVIGASSRLDTIGGRLWRNLQEGGFRGPLYAVNPRAATIDGARCYASVEEIPGPVELALILVRREAVLETVEACGRKGVRGLVVITAGFREVGAEGAELERELVERVRRLGMRMIGPNCFGVLNTDPAVGLNATFAKYAPLRGRVGVITQSGALGQIIMEYALSYGVGFSLLASIGNQANVTGNDLLLYGEDDPDTDLWLLYLESFGDAGCFSQIARRLARRKPILAVKAGRTEAGARATVSHTGALAGSDAAVDALFQQCGVLRLENLEELFDITQGMASQPIPRGDRVAIMTNAGGPAVLATDEVVRQGLRMAELAASTRAHLRSFLAPAASVENPVDMLATGSPEEYREVMRALLGDPGVDALVVIYVPPLFTDSRAVLENVRATAGETDKTMLACVMGAVAREEAALLQEGPRIPSYRFPESAARALGAMVRYGRWRDREEGTVRSFPVDRARAARLLGEARARGERVVTGAAALEILSAYGVPVAPSRFVPDGAGLAPAAAELGFPLVMKVALPAVVHKTEVGGVCLDLRDQRALLEAYAALDRRVRESVGRSAPTPVLLQPMLRGGVETVMGMSVDPTFGPLLMFGLGGVTVELWKDVAFRVVPLTDRDAREMIEGLRGLPLLAGFRGAPAADRALLEECLLRLSQLVGDFPEIRELDVNPFLARARGEGSAAVDARFALAD